MAAPKGNDYNVKWKTPEERKAVCKKYCKHLSQGLSEKSFPECDIKTIKRYVEDYPKDFPPDLIADAKRRGRLLWEKAGLDGMWMGNKFNDRVWSFNMKNRYKEDWRDSHDITSGGEKLDTLHALLTSPEKGSTTED